MILVSLIFALQDGVSRYLATNYHVITVVTVRFWFFAIVTVVWSVARGGGLRRVARSAHPRLQITRGVLLIVEIWVTVIAFVKLGLIATHSIFAVYPLLVAALAGPLLGEYVGWRRGVAILVGLLGVVIILRPGFRVFDPAAVYPLAGAFMFAIYSLLTRRVAWQDSADTTFFYTGVVGALVSTLAVPFFWTPIHGADWIWMAMLCLQAVAGHFLLIKVYEVAEASVVQPFAYFQLVFIGILGIAFFNERPDGMTLAGAALILAAGLYTLLRQKRLGIRPPESDAAAPVGD
ncbi:MAG: EamA family transporter [Rhodovulum sulfidophilum]|uniref:EamA family transporter n=1 Tax=Rhodovulum sulfidophilum TaxID=35806 RepID=A0A2W5QM96_RHOSU|nr:MAG: EamA family transporter [Rhodovulum sulfidophilum]